MTRDWKLNILQFPGVNVSPLEKTPMVSNLVFVPLARNLGGLPGVLVDQIQFGAFQLSFNVSYQSSIYRPFRLTSAIATSILGFRRRGKSKIGQLCYGKSVYWHTQFPLGFGTSTQTYILHQGNCLSNPLSTAQSDSFSKDPRTRYVPCSLLSGAGAISFTMKFGFTIKDHGRRTMGCGLTSRRPTGRTLFSKKNLRTL